MNMYYQLLYSIIEKDVSLTEEDKLQIAEIFQYKTYKKNSFLIRAGEVAHEVFFIIDGAAHQYYIDENGNEKSCAFMFENEFTTDLESFSGQTPATSFTVTLQPAKCLVARCTELGALIRNNKAIVDFFRILVERIAATSFKRTKSLLTLSPEERFRELLNEQPEIFQKLPQRYIAQYVGIAPESLSRIKNRIYRNQKS